MNKRLKNRHHMIRAVITFLNEHEDTFKDNTHYAELLADMRKKTEGLEKLRNELTILNVPFATRKETAKQSFEYALTCLNRLMIDYAMKANDNGLLATVKEVGADLRGASYIDAMDAGSTTLQNAESILETIKGMNRGEEVYNNAVAALANYAEFGAKGRYRRNTIKELNERFVDEQDDCVAYIRGPVETFFYTLSTTHPELYAQFRIHRLIPNLGRRRAKTAADAEGENATASTNTETTTEVAEGSTAEAEGNSTANGAESGAAGTEGTATDDTDSAEVQSA